MKVSEEASHAATAGPEETQRRAGFQSDGDSQKQLMCGCYLWLPHIIIQV